MSPTPPFAEGQRREVPKSYYQSQRLDPQMPSEKQGGGPLEKQGGEDMRSQTHEQDMEISYEDNHVLTFEDLEQIFFGDIMKLSKEQTDAEDAENARHIENEEQLVALRTQRSSLRDEFLRRESQARQQQNQQISKEQYPNNGIVHSSDPCSLGPSDPRSMGPSDPRNMGFIDPRGYNTGSAAAGEQHRAYNSEYNDSYREHGRFPGNNQDHEYEPKVP